MPSVDKPSTTDLRFRPITPDSLSDINRFSNEHGKFSYCSCMRWRMTSSEFRNSSKPERIEALNDEASSGKPIGVLAYCGNRPVGWCSIAPRRSYAALERYRALPPIDDEPVWSIVCFFIDSRHRRQGLTLRLIKAAVDYAASEGALIIEGYPVEPDAPSYTYMGSPNTFLRAGFIDVTPPGQKRSVVRHHVRVTERRR